MAALNLGFTCHFQVLWGGVGGGDLDEILIFQGRNVGMEETRWLITRNMVMIKAQPGVYALMPQKLILFVLSCKKKKKRSIS